MADNVAQSIKDLQKDLAALDKQLLSNNANWDKLGQTIVDSMKRGGLGLDDLFSQMKSQKDVLKLRAIIDRDALMEDVKNLQTSVNEGLKNVKVGGVEITGQRQIEQALDGYKAQLKLVPKTLAEAYDYAVKIANTLGGGNSSKASKEWLERTALNTKEKKALDDATNGYIKQTQAIQDLNRTLDELKQKRATAEAIPVTGVGKSGISYKTDASKQSALGKIDKEIEATETKINNATTAAQKFQAQLIAMQGEKKTKAMSRALGVEEAEAEVQKIPTVFDRVIAQINQRAAQSKDKFAKQLVNAEGLRNEAKNAAAEVSNELNYIWRGSQSHMLAAWRSNTGYLTDFGRQDAVNQIKLSQEYKSNLDALKTQEVRDKLTQALTRYKDALQAVITLEEQQRRSASQYSAQERAVEGVTRRFNENEQAIARVRDRWDELNVKRQAGLVNEKDFKANSQKLLDEYDRLIAKRKEFETADIGQSLSERLRKQQEEEKRLEADRVRSAKETSKIITEERGKQALSSLIGSPKMNAAVQQQLKYMQQIRSIGKDINALQSNKNRSAEENALLEKRKKELSDVLELQKRLNNERKGSANLARQIDKYNQLRGKVKETTDEVKRQKTSLESMLPTLRRLASAFGVAFSVQGLVNFGRKLVETRGEFEMQFVAMKSIIGDVDAATKIWNQTMQQALQSPKTFKELTTYTKQLAAYRIETDKLFDTTKRLADVSAGLGVDMGRLILAYGQVKAANYLRASEVRQFTEAGVNIYGELAKYFSEIEGRAVGTAEVVERVSKRMVLFSDVEKIFQRMTDEGGTFFNMQEIQADTVLGQINKLHDAYDQMLNTIGQANQGTIRNLLETLNDLVRNWQNVAFVLKRNVNWITLIGAALYALSRNYLKGATTQTLWFSKAIMGNSKVLLKDTADIKIFSKVIGDYSLKTRVAVVATRTLQGALSKLGNVARAIWPLVVFEGAVLLIERLTRASRELKRFREELEAVTSENVGRMNEEISGYDALIKKLQKTNEGTAARKEILDEISNKYGKYLDFIVTEKTTVDELAGAYDNVVSSIRNYTAEKIREEQQQKLEKGIYDEYQDLINSLTNKRIADERGNQFKITKEQAKNIAKLIQQSLDKYGVVDIQSILETYFDKALGLTGAGGENASIGNIIRKYIGEYSSLNQELQNIRNDIEGQTPVFSSDAEYNDYKKRVQDANAALAEQAKKNEQIINEIKNKERAESDSWKIEDEISAQRIKNSEEELRIRKQYGLLTEQQYKDAIKRLHGELDSYETDYNTRLAKALSDQYGKTWKTSNKEARDMYNYVVSTEDALQQGTAQRNKQLVESYKGLKESLKEYKEQLSAAQKTGAGEDAIKKIQGDIDWATLMMKAIELAAKLRGLDLTDKKKGRTARNYDSISSLISLLKEMNSEYDKLSKSAYGFAKSNQKVVESFSPAFKEIFGFAGIDISQVDTTSKRATADAMKLAIDTLDKKNLWGKFGSDGGKKARKEFIKAWSQEDVEADIEVQVRIREDFGRQMEEAFGNYELTLDLQKLNLPSDVLSDLFDLETVDLSDLRRKVVDFYNERLAVEADPTDLIKQVEGYYKKIDDMERKQQRDRIKDYAKYLEYELSERAKIEMEYTRKSADVAANQAFTSEQKEQIQKRLKEERDKAIAKQEWEDFKSSETYIQMMEDLEHQGTNALIAMRTELERIRENAENLSPRALKEVVNALEKIDEITIRRGMPISNIRNAAAGVRSARVEALESGLSWNQVSSRKAAKQTQADIKAQLLPMEQQFNILQSQLGAEKEIARLEQERYENGLKLGEVFGETFMTGDNEYLNEKIAENLGYIELTQENINSLIEKRKTAEGKEEQEITSQIATENTYLQQLYAENELLQKQLEYNLAIAKESLKRAATPEERASLQARINELEEELKKLREQDAAVGNLTKKYGILGDSVQDAVQKLAGWSQQAVDVFNSFKTMMTSLGVDTDTDAWDDWSTAFETIGTVASTAASMATKIASGDYIGAALDAVKGVMDIVSQWAGNNDRELERQIQKQQERIDALKDAYARLERQIEKTWSSVSYMQTYEQQVQNIREQIDAMEAQMRAEEAKKNTDDNAVRQYQRDIQDAYDQLEELEQKSIEVFGGIGEEGYRSAAEGFVDAWKSAFLETGDGLQGLQDHFNEFLQDWFVKQGTMQAVAGYYSKVWDYVNSIVKDGGLPTQAEIEQARELADEAAVQSDAFLQAIAGIFNLQGEGSLSGLAAGIQGMTEEQANILEAYWNSVRMYTASIDVNVARIASVITSGGVGENFVGGRPSEIEVGVSMGDMKTSINRLATTLLDNNESTNPMLQQLTIIAHTTNSINTLLQSVVRSGHSLGGYGLKVFPN